MAKYFCLNLGTCWEDCSNLDDLIEMIKAEEDDGGKWETFPASRSPKAAAEEWGFKYAATELQCEECYSETHCVAVKDQSGKLTFWLVDLSVRIESEASSFFDG